MTYKLVIEHEPQVEEMEFATLEELQAKVAELAPKPAEGEGQPADQPAQ